MPKVSIFPHEPIKNRHMKDKASGYYRYAIKKGLIKRGSRCEDCGTSEGRIEGHHADYAKPFDVVWVCKRCHSVRHGRASPEETKRATVMLRPKVRKCVLKVAKKAGLSASQWIAARIDEHFLSEAREKV